MTLIHATYAADSIQQGRVTGYPGQRIGGIRRQCNETPASGYFGGLLDQARLRMLGVNME
jgi:hypothetical protein